MTVRDLNLGPVAASGSDVLPFHAPPPKYPRARLRAMRDAQARREQERPRPFDVARLRDDLRALRDVRNWTPGNDGDLRAELARRGWTPGKLAAAEAALRDDLQGRVHPRRPSLVAGGGPGGESGPSQSRPSLAVAPGRTGADLRGMAGNIALAKRMGLDPAKLWPGQVGLPGKPSTSWLVAAAGLELPATADQEPVAPWTGVGWSTTPQPAKRRAQGRRRP
jgi:hypothetical protein